MFAQPPTPGNVSQSRRGKPKPKGKTKMTDKIVVQFTRNTDADGNGGTIAESPGVVLGNSPTGPPMYDLVMAAYADAYPIPQVDGDELDEQGNPIKINAYSLERHVSVCWKQHTDAIFQAYLIKVKKAAEAAQDAALKAALDNSYKTV